MCDNFQMERFKSSKLSTVVHEMKHEKRKMHLWILNDMFLRIVVADFPYIYFDNADKFKLWSV